MKRSMTRFNLIFFVALAVVACFAMAEECEPKGMTEITVERSNAGAIAAEAVAMSMRRRYGASTTSGMSFVIDNAIARCQAISGATLAEKEQENQRTTPYLCGMALQFMVAAATQRDPLDIRGTLLQKAGSSEADCSSFIQAAANKGRTNKDALTTLGDMSASRIDWDVGIAQLAVDGLLHRRSDAELAEPAYAKRHRAAAIFHLLGQRCRTSYGFNSTPPFYIRDAPAGTCGNVTDQFHLLAMNGRSLDTDADRAHLELARRRMAAIPVELTDEQRHTITLPCHSPLPAIVLYSLSADHF